MSSFTLSGTSFDLVSSLARAYCFSSLRLAKECYEANHHHTIIDRFIWLIDQYRSSRGWDEPRDRSDRPDPFRLSAWDRVLRMPANARILLQQRRAKLSSAAKKRVYQNLHYCSTACSLFLLIKRLSPRRLENCRDISAITIDKGCVCSFTLRLNAGKTIPPLVTA